jgi:RNA polymerase sigma-70 factor (ECF subfamily)
MGYSMQVTQLDNTTQIFNQYRGLLFSIAYRMLSSATDAEDIVQEAFIRWMEARPEDVQSPRAYLCSIVVRLCIDQLRSARAKREVYVGPWLPEPLSTEQHPELVQTAMLAESLSFAFLVMLENLKPLERAVFLLREVFEYDYEEIAAIVGKSAANCRQVLHRAHERLGERRPRFAVSHEQQEQITHQFLRASTGGDMQGLLNLLTTDIVLTADGGGKAQAGLKPVYGADRVSRGFMGSMRKMPAGVVARVEEINGQPALVGYLDGRPDAVVLLEIEQDRVGRVYIVMNPDKLGWLPPESA